MYFRPQVSVMTGSPHGEYTGILIDTYGVITWYWQISRTTAVFIGAFAKLRKETIICVITVRLYLFLLVSVRPSVCMEQLASHRTDFHEIWYLSILRKSIEKIQALLNSDKNSRYFTWRTIYIYDRIWLISS